jgi:hypothetical protein
MVAAEHVVMTGELHAARCVLGIEGVGIFENR